MRLHSITCARNATSDKVRFCKILTIVGFPHNNQVYRAKCNICVCFLTKTSCFKIPILSERYHWIVFGYAQVCLATVTQPGGLINKNLSESTCAIRLSSGAALFRSEVVLMTSNSCKYLFEVIS